MVLTFLERLIDTGCAGDMYFQGISAMSFLKHWPDMAEEYERNSLAHAWIETFKHDGCQMFAPHKIGERLHADGLPPGVAPGSFQMRPLMYNMFLRQTEKLGIPIHYGKRVVDYFETANKGGVELEGGEKYEADIVIAADGVGSKSQSLVGGPVRARSSGRAMWRAVFPISHLDKRANAREFFRLHDGTEPIVRTFFGYVYDAVACANDIADQTQTRNVRPNPDQRRPDHLDREPRCKHPFPIMPAAPASDHLPGLRQRSRNLAPRDRRGRSPFPDGRHSRRSQVVADHERSGGMHASGHHRQL